MTEIPENIGPILREIDAELKAQGVLPHQRSAHAVIAFGKRFNISLPLFRLNPSSPRVSEAVNQEHVTVKIYEWFDEIYGERINVDPSSKAKVAVLAHGDLWEMRIPLVWGTEITTATKDFTLPKNIVSQGPIYTNAAVQLEKITPARLSEFTDADLAETLQMYDLGRLVRTAFDSFRNDHRLFPIAESNWSAAVFHLTAQNADYGESRWSSLQLVEKFMKGLLYLMDDATAEEIKDAGHELKKLHRLLVRSIRDINLMPLAKEVQCTAQVRYGEVVSTRDQAYKAHKSALRIVASLGSIKNGNEP